MTLIKRLLRLEIPKDDAEMIFYFCKTNPGDDELKKLAGLISKHGISKIDNLLDQWTRLNPLMMALDCRNVSVARALYEAGSDVTKSIDLGFSVFLGSCKDEKFLDIMQACIRNGSSPNEVMGDLDNTAIGLAVASRNVDGVSTLLSCGADPSYKNIPLIQWGMHNPYPAAEIESDWLEYLRKSNAILLKLIDAGANINRVGIGGVTPLQQCLKSAVSRPNWVGMRMVEMLLEKGADPNIISSGLQSNSLECCHEFSYITLLASRGANIPSIVTGDMNVAQVLEALSIGGVYNGEFDFLLLDEYDYFVENNGLKLDECGHIISRNSNDGPPIFWTYLEDLEGNLERIIRGDKNSSDSRIARLIERLLVD